MQNKHLTSCRLSDNLLELDQGSVLMTGTLQAVLEGSW